MGKENSAEEMKKKAEDLENNQEELQEAENEVKEDATEGEEEVSELDKLKAELSEQKDKYIRLYSEFENFRRRTAKEKLEMVKTANEGLISDLLPVVDDFERADKSYSEEVEVKAMKEGIDLIYDKLVKALEKKGVSVIEVKQGSDFDPEFQEAITQIPAPEKELKGKVVDVIEKGYLLGEKVIRFTKVVTGA